MATLTLRDVPEPLLDRLRALAAEEGRSLDQQAIVLLEEAVRRSRSFAAAFGAFVAEEGELEPGLADVLDASRSREPGRDPNV